MPAEWKVLRNAFGNGATQTKPAAAGQQPGLGQSATADFVCIAANSIRQGIHAAGLMMVF